MLTAGERFGAYEILGLIAKGGMGAVYRARDGQGKVVALKTLAEQFRGDASMRARFDKEPRLAPLHPNIVRILDAGEFEGVPYFAMDLVEGRGLDALLSERGALTPDEFFPILSDVAAAIDGAHYAGVVHRDIKPSNIMLRASDGRAVLTDFGIAKRTAPGADTGLTGSTQAGAIIGTVRYMSPEQALGKPVTPVSDVYSLGAMAYEILSGRPPFVADEAFALMRMHIQETPQDLHALKPAVSPEVAAVVAHAMAKEASDRFPSAGEFSRAFFQALRGAPAAAPAPVADIGATRVGVSPGSMAAPARSGSRALPVVVGMVAALLVLAAGVWYFALGGNGAGAGSPATADGTPVLLAPAPNTVFAVFPRNTNFEWRAVPGATSYTAEIDCLNCCEQGKWCADVGRSVKRTVNEPRLTLEFFGAQPGRFRVWALFAGGREGAKSDWSAFSYTR